MKTIEKAGGIAALYLAAAYVAAMPFFLFVVDFPSIVDPLQKLEALIAHRNGIYAMELVVYVFFGIFLVLLAVALRERMKAGAPDLMRAATPIALIWAGLLIASGMIHNVGMGPAIALYGEAPEQAVSLWSAIDLVSSGLSGNGEILGGTWMLLVSVAALRSGGLPKALNILGLAIASVGIASVVPALKELAYVFGLGQILWFSWLGVVLLRVRPGLPSKSALIALSALALSLLPAGPAAYAEAATETAADASEQRGWYLAIPVYLYGGLSASGVQLGYQKGRLHLRLDGSFVSEYQEGDQVVFANPSLGAFISHEWESRIRIYEGITVGVETGLMNSFEGLVYTLSYQMGAEWLVFNRKSFYVEFGAGVGILPKEGAFNGGTIVGGGIKCYL